MTEQALNSSVPFEISLHNFGHEDLNGLLPEQLNSTFGLSVDYHKRIGNKIRAEAPPWNSNADSSKYPIYTQNGIFVYNRAEGPMSEPYEASPDLWIIPREGAFRRKHRFS